MIHHTNQEVVVHIMKPVKVDGMHTHAPEAETTPTGLRELKEDCVVYLAGDPRPELTADIPDTIPETIIAEVALDDHPVDKPEEQLVAI